MNVLSESIPLDVLASRLGSLAHPARLKILQHLSSQHACCCKEIVECLDLAQSTVSQHLKILVEAGLVTYTQQRPRSCYRVDRAALAALADGVTHLVETCCATQAPAAHSYQDQGVGK